MIEDYEFVGGNPSLDFINTVGGIRSGESQEKLNVYEDLLEWAATGSVLNAARRAVLSSAALRSPRAAENALARAKKLRESIHNVYFAVAHGQPVPRSDLAALNTAIGRALAHARIHWHGEAFEWGWDDHVTLDTPVWPVVSAAAELLVSQKTARLRECASDTCGWLFLDTSKNRSRRWCDMKGCGNREKVRRFRGLVH